MARAVGEECGHRAAGHDGTSFNIALYAYSDKDSASDSISLSLEEKPNTSSLKVADVPRSSVVGAKLLMVLRSSNNMQSFLKFQQYMSI